MPKRKKLPKLPDYVSIPNNENKLTVQKSNPLQSLSETGMTLAEFKLLDAYLSRIDSNDEEQRYIRFEKGELERILGVSKISKSDLSKRLDGLFRVVTIQDKHKRNGFTKIALFEKAEAIQDENGLWQVDLACTPSAMEYVFNIQNIGYLQYRLKNIIELTSRYSYVLYLYLENRRKSRKLSKSWNVPLDELKAMLRCTADTYSQYKRFNDLILKKCQKELHEKTDLRFTYTPVTRGRKVIAIHFTVETIASIIPSAPTIQELPTPRQCDKDDKEILEIDYGSDLANLLGDCACDNEFTPEQIRVIQDLVIKVFPYSTDHMKMCNYLLEKVHKMNYYQPQSEKRFTYLCKMIESDIRN